MKKVLRFTVSLLLFASVLISTAYAVSANVKEVDGNKIISVFVTEHSGNIQDAADIFYEDNFIQSDGIMLLVDINSREYYILTYGNCIDIFNDSVISSIEDNVIPYLSRNDWNGAESRFFSLCTDRIRSFSETPSLLEQIKTWAIKIAVALGIGVSAGGLPLMSSKKELKSVKPKVNAVDYELKGSFYLSYHTDRFINSNIVRVPIPRDDNHHSGSGFGSGGGSTIHVSSSGNTFGGHGGRF